MVLILSEENDFSTNDVIDWLIYYRIKFVRINSNDQIKLNYLCSDVFEICCKKQIINSINIDSVWYRRGNFFFDLTTKRNNIFINYNHEENKVIKSHIHNILSLKRSLNNFNFSDENKLDILSEAKKLGLNTSNYLVTQSKDVLQDFFKEHKQKVISKALKRPFNLITDDGIRYHTYTYFLKEKDIEKLPDTFNPTFFQEALDKKYEVRTFYMTGDFYSMAIFSQNNKKTKFDYRHYDQHLPNRNTPYKLPDSYKKGLDKLLRRFSLNSASMDIIVSTKGEFFLIDVNPIGQFGMTSIPCNYNLEKKIARYLAYGK